MEEAREFESAREIMELTVSYEERGRKKGREEEKKEVALHLLRDGVDARIIMRATGLTEKELSEIKKEL